MMKAVKRTYTVLRDRKGADLISFCPFLDGLHVILTDEIKHIEWGITIPNEDMPTMTGFLYYFTGAKDWRKVYDDFKSHMMDKYGVRINDVYYLERTTRDIFSPEGSVLGIFAGKDEDATWYFFSTPTVREMYRDLLYSCTMATSVI